MKATARKHGCKSAEDYTGDPSSGVPDRNERIAAEAEIGEPEAS